MPTTNKLLQRLGLVATTLSATLDPTEQLKLVGKGFLLSALHSHPDKGGCEEAFRDVHDAFNQLRARMGADKGKLRLLRIDDDHDDADVGVGRCWQFGAAFYTEAGTHGVPAYAAEPAKSSRGVCVVCTKPIAKGALRLGSLNTVTGSFGRWAHVDGCARIPSVVHAFLPADLAHDAVKEALCAMDGLTVEGILSLNDAQLQLLCDAVSDTTRWAKTTKPKKNEIEATKAAAAAATDAPTGASTTTTATTTTLATAATTHAPAPNVVTGALAGKTVVLTGVFDAIGGTGMARGKGGVKGWVEAAGGRVTTSVSKKTDFLIAGTLPGAAKVDTANELGVVVLTVDALKSLLEGDTAPPQAADLTNVAFSRGYGGNGRGVLRLKAVADDDDDAAEPAAKRLCA